MKRTLFLSAVFLFMCVYSTSAHLVNPPSRLDTIKKDKNYVLVSKTENVGFLSLKKLKNPGELLTVRFGFPTPIPVSNRVGTAVQGDINRGGDPELPTFDKIEIIKGKYSDVKAEKDTKYRTLFTFTGIEFPLHLNLYSGKEMIDFMLLTPGNWSMNIELKNN